MPKGRWKRAAARKTMRRKMLKSQGQGIGIEKLPGEEDNKKRQMLEVLEELKKKLAEVERLKQELERQRVSFSSTPQQTKALVEEITVPPLEAIKAGHLEEKKKQEAAS